MSIHALIILDGFGHAKESPKNAITTAGMPFLNSLKKRYPSALLAASGHAVGLPDGMCGNSEVGHLTIGAGAVTPSVQLQLDRLNQQNVNEVLPGLNELFMRLKASGGRLQLIGMTSDGGGHSHIAHLYALINAAKNAEICDIYVHAITDGREVPPQSAARYLKPVSDLVPIASVHGRFYAMDRDKKMERTQASLDVLQGAVGIGADSWESVLTDSYRAGLSDEDIVPVLLDSQGVIQPGDGVLCFNIRPDRARQLTAALAENIDSYSFLATLGYFDERFEQQSVVPLVRPALPQTTLLAQLELQATAPTLCLAESEKAAHITYFFDGRREHVRKNITSHIIPSQHPIKPAMQAELITEQAVAFAQAHRDGFLAINYANADMLGHTGVFDPTVAACKVLDTQFARLHEVIVEQQGGSLLITADHGNAEQMIDASGGMCKAHTTNPVPFILAAPEYKGRSCAPGSWGLSNVAATFLQHVGCQVPDEMDEPITIL